MDADEVALPHQLGEAVCAAHPDRELVTVRLVRILEHHVHVEGLSTSASHADRRREQEEAIKRHQARYKRFQDRINAMYVDKLDGLVDTAFFKKISN